MLGNFIVESTVLWELPNIFIGHLTTDKVAVAHLRAHVGYACVTPSCIGSERQIAQLCVSIDESIWLKFRTQPFPGRVSPLQEPRLMVCSLLPTSQWK